MEEEKINELDLFGKLLDSKKEIDVRVKLYTSNQISFLKLIDSINLKLIAEVDEYKKAKLEIEKNETEIKCFYEKKELINWNIRLDNFNYDYSILLKECEDNFDSIIEECRLCENINVVHQAIINSYNHIDEESRIMFYLYVKKAVNDSKLKLNN